MKKNYQTKAPSAATPEVIMPDAVSVTLTELAGAVKEGLLALAVGTGFQVMHAVLDESVLSLCGPKGKHDPDRLAVRHGTENGSVVLGGRKVPIRHPRVRSADDEREIAVPAYESFTNSDLLDELTLGRMMAKLSTRRYGVGLEPVGTAVEKTSKSTSKSAVSRRFVKMTEKALEEMMQADLSGLDIVALLVDGVGFGEHLCVVALGIDIDGKKYPLGIIEGTTENATVVKDLLVDLRERGLDVTKPIYVAIDGAKALHSAVKSVFDQPIIQRCQEHKIRNVIGYLPDSLRSTVTMKMRNAYHQKDATTAEAALRNLAADLDKSHPGAAASLREGLDETLSVIRLGVHESLARTLRSTNTIESMIEICRDHSTNVKRWQDGTMALRWCAAGMVEAKKQFRRVSGFKHLPALRVALEKQAPAPKNANTESVAATDYAEVAA
jgi:putative transposase